jgi:hypothetical protein
MATENIGGAGALLFMYGPPIVGTVAGAIIDKKNRLRGGAIGFGAGVAAFFALNAYVQAKNDQLLNAPPVTVTNLKNPGNPYMVSSPNGDVVALATAAGFHVDGSQPHGAGPIQAVWQGADGAPVPAGLFVQQPAALAQ